MSCLSLYLLGPPRTERDGVPIKVDTRKATALLVYIAITGESHRRDSLVNLLWPEYDQTRGRAALRRTLSALRKALAGDWLDVDRETVGLDPDTDVWLDVDQFHSHLAQCLTHGHPATEVCPACLAPLTAAVDLYRGDFLSGFSLKDSFNFDDWQFFQADSLRRELAGALEGLVKCHSARGEFEPAIEYARRWLVLDRLDEAAHCELMRLYAWSGQRSAALRQYQECVKILGSALSVCPQEATTALYQAIQEGRIPVPPVDKRFLRPEERRERATPPLSAMPPVLTDEEKRIVTVVCADVSGSFRAMGDVTSEDEAALIRRFLGVVEGGLARYGGEVDRVLGGRVLGVFGATRAHESDPELAIRAALEIQEEADRLGLSVTAGIYTGEVHLSRAGGEGHREYTLMGTVIDLAARLAGKARAGQILVGEPTQRLAWRAFEFTPLTLDIKGVVEQVAAYQVERLLPQSRKARGIEGLRAELVGRDEEFTRLKRALAQALEGRGQIVSLIGEAGVGKSRLVAELKEVALAPEDGRPIPLWLEGRCLELGTAASYTPFIDIFRGYFAWGAQDDDHSRRERIVSSLREMVKGGDLSEEHVEGIYPFLGRLLSVHLEDEWEERLADDGPEQTRRRTLVAVHDFVVALSKRRPVVLVFEDLHWADDLSLDLISLLMEGLRLGPLLLLCVYRVERRHKCWHLGTIASQKCRGRYTELRLRELTYRQSQELIESLLTIGDLSSSTRDLILSRTQGNPFFIEEVVRSLIDRGIFYRDEGRWRARDEVDSVVIPESVQSVILSRLDHLDGDLKQVLQVASVIGRLFRRRVLAYAAQEQAELESVLWRLEDRALVYQERTVPEVEYSFKHVLTRETVYQSILRHHRQKCHLKVAEAIEVLYPDNLEEYCEQLAYHCEKGGDTEKAIAYLLRAGEKAKQSFANEAAIAHFSRGLELLEALPITPERARLELDLRVALGVPLVLTRGHAAPEVESTYARARELSEQVGDTDQRFHVLLGLRRLYLHRGELQTARELGEQLLALSESLRDVSHISRAHMMHGETLYRSGAFTEAREHYEYGIARYTPQQYRSQLVLYGNDTQAVAKVFQALVLWHIGHPDQALDTSLEGLSRAQKLSHPFTLVCALYFTAALRHFRGEGQAAQEQVESLLRICTERRFALYSAWGTVLWGRLLAEQGEIEQGITQMRQGLAAWRAMGAELLLPEILSFLAEACGKAGKVEEGFALLTEALALVEKNGERCWEAEIYRLKGELLLQSGAGGQAETNGLPVEGEAESCFQRALEVARRQSARSWELRAATSLSRLWQRQGRNEEARELLAGVYGWFTEGFDTADLKEAKALLDVLA